MKKVKVKVVINDWVVDIDDPTCRRWCWKEYWAFCPVCKSKCGITETGWTWSICSHYRGFDQDQEVMYFES